MVEIKYYFVDKVYGVIGVIFMDISIELYYFYIFSIRYKIIFVL